MHSKHVISLLILVPFVLWTGCQGHHQGHASSENAQNHEWHIVVAENGLSKERLLEVGQQFQNLIGKRAAAGDVVTLYSAPSHQTACSIVVPDGHANARLRDPSVKKFGIELGRIFAPETAPDGNAHVRLPDLVNAIASGRRTEFPSRVVIFGNPLFMEPTWPDWSMTDGKFPGDGTLEAEYSPYNITGRYPDDTRINWLLPKSRWGGVHSQYEEAVNRFNRLLIQNQNACLTRITSDAQMAFVFDNPQFTDSIEAREEPAIMHRFQQTEKPAVRQAEASNETSTEDLPEAVTETSSEVSPDDSPEVSEVETLLQSAEADDGKIALAIEWTSEEQECDLDLWIECDGHAEKLYYGNKTTTFGEHFRDVMSSTGGETSGSDFRGMEWLEIHHNRLDELTCWIHVYRGSRPANVRMIRVWNGQRCEKTFQIDPSQAWNKIDLRNF